MVSHRQNRLNVRQFELGTELGLSGELFVTFHTNPFDGMTYIRTVPASLINDVEVDGEDRERELRFHEDSSVQSVDGVTRTGSQSTEGRWWSSEEMRHYAINRVTGAVRGQGELVAVLPWLSRYKDWLTDRVLINRYKGAFLWDVTLEGADRAAILARRAELAEAPKPGSILLHNERETWQAIQPAIGSSDVERDGHALRLMIAAGAGVPLHFLAEGQDTNVATAREMARPTLRHYGRRQLVVGEMFEDIANEALRRSGRFGEGPWGVRAVFEDLSRRDTEESARATKAGAEGWRWRWNEVGSQMTNQESYSIDSQNSQEKQMSYQVKLGPHVQSWSRLDPTVVHERMRPPILKTLEVSENLRRYKDEVGGLVVARSYVPELEARVVDEEPAVVASLMRDRLLGEWKNYRDCIDYFELLNEVAQTGEDLKRLTEFTVECCRLLNDEGHRVAVGSFSVGNPPDMARDWQTFKPAVYAADAIALHEYGAPYVWSQPGYHQSRNPRSQLVVSEISPGERADGQDIRAGLAAAVHHHRVWDRPRAVQRGPEGMEVIEDIAGRVREATGLVQRRAGEGRLRPGRHGVRLRDERRLGRLRAGRSGGVRRLHRRRGAGTNSAAEAGGISGDQARAGLCTGRGLAQSRGIRALGAGPDREW